MAIANGVGAIASVGLGAVGDGCPRTADGDCILNGMPVSCSIIRECDSVTGNLHYEYALPYDTSNVNINMADPLTQKIIGYQNEKSQFVDTADIPIASIKVNAPTTAAVAQNAAQAIETAKQIAVQQALNRGASAFAAAIEGAKAAATAAASFTANNAAPVNNQAGYLTGVVVNTPQTTTSQQGKPSNTTTTNTNVATGGGMTNTSVTTGTGNNSTLQTFSDLMTTGSNWLSGKTFGISNTWLALGGVFALAAGGSYLGGSRRGR